MKNNITIRKTEPSDAESIQAIYACQSAYTNTFHLPHQSIDIWTKRLANIPDNVHSYVAVIGDELDGEIVGNLALVLSNNPRQRHSATFGMAVKDNQHGKGVGSALLSTAIDLADNWLNIHRIEMTVYTDNESAIALYKKFGFVIEGEAIDFAYRNGEYVNAYYMARIKEKIRGYNEHHGQKLRTKASRTPKNKSK